MSPRIFEIPFLQLEKWRKEAHIKLDQLAEQKRQEIQCRIAEYQTVLLKRTTEQKQRLDSIRKRFNDVSRQQQSNHRELKSLEEKLDQTREFLHSIEKHSIKVSAYDFFVNIRTHFFDSQATRTVQTLPPPVPPPVPPSPSPSIRSSRPESKDPKMKTRPEKKRSLSVCLL